MKSKKQILGKHEQHTKSFVLELNNVQNNNFKPFRLYDETWIIGKFKGRKLSQTPLWYLRWALQTFRLSSTAKTILKDRIKVVN